MRYRISRLLPALLFLILPPNHLIHNPGITLNQLDHLGTDILLHIIWYRNPLISVKVHLYRNVHRLQKRLLINARQHKTSFI